MKIDYFQSIGSRSEQQDRFVIKAATDGVAVSVLDGHGGLHCVDTAALCLENDVIPRYNPKEENEEIVRDLQGMCSRFQNEGSTLSSAYIFHDKTYVSILGDSPCYIIKDNQITKLPVHDISNKKELELRMKAGASRSLSYPKHILNKVGQGLSTFRCLGDQSFENIVGRNPDWHEIEDFDFLVVASDGLKLENQTILENLSEGARRLVETNEKTFSKTDNTTVIIVSR